MLAVYRALLEAGHDPGRIAVAGDSAGGCLAAVLLQDILREGLPMPAVAALISPATDLRGTAPSLEENRRRDHLLPASWVRRAVAAGIPAALLMIWLDVAVPRWWLWPIVWADIGVFLSLGLYVWRR